MVDMSQDPEPDPDKDPATDPAKDPGQRGRRKRAPGLTEMDTFVKNPSAAGVTFGASVVLFTLLGYALDKYLGSLPLFLLIGLAIGTVGGFIHLVETVSPGTLFKSRRTRAQNPKKKREDRE